LINTQLTPSELIAMDDCVLARVLISRRRKRAQLSQLQFHWGKPPPAAEPKTCTCIKTAAF
jgi:hypothetical protein